MGDLRFTVPHSGDFDPRVWDTAYITGIEGIPWYCHHQLRGDQFSIGREIEESGKLNIVWPTKSAGNLCLATTSLPIADTPYSLAVEIARGTVSRLKSQTSEWQRVGLRLPDKFFPLAEDSLSQLLRAVTTVADQDQQLKLSQRAIDLAIDASIMLCNTFSVQALEARRQTENRLSTLFGIQVAHDMSMAGFRDSVLAAFNLICVAPEYGLLESTSGKQPFESFDEQIDWAIQEDKKTCVGPLVNFRKDRLPRWMVLLEQGFEAFLRAACDHVEMTVERYRGKAHIWNCAAGLNIPNVLGWSDEQVLRMAVSLIETVRRMDERSPVLLTIDQPWSEYLRDDADGISPLHFADALIRADLGLSGLALDLYLDHWPNGSFPRDPIEINRLIDRWSLLGLPLMVILSCPTESGQPADERVTSWQTPFDCSGSLKPENIVQLLISKPSVHAVIWNNTLAREAPSRGLWNINGQPKPILKGLTGLRKAYLH